MFYVKNERPYKILNISKIGTTALPFPSLVFLLFWSIVQTQLMQKTDKKLQKSFLGKLSFMLMCCTEINSYGLKMYDLQQ